MADLGDRYDREHRIGEWWFLAVLEALGGGAAPASDDDVIWFS